MTARDRLIVSIVVAVVAVLAAWLLVIAPKRDQAARLARQIQTAQQALIAANQQASAARADQSMFAHNYATVARLGEAVPSDDDVPSLIYQLQDAASRSGVDFRSLVLTSSSGGATTGAASGSLPPGATVGPAGFPTMPFTFTFQGNFFHLADFFGALERFVVATERRIDVHGRLMTLNAISLGPGAAGFPQILATISATTYLLPASQGLTNGATASGPAGSSTPVSTGSSAASSSGSTTTSPPTAAVTP